MRGLDGLRDAAADALARAVPRLWRAAGRLRARDPLTGVLTRSTWLRRAGRRLRGRTAGAVLLFDMDRLAHLNAALGIEAGDACLIAFARLLSKIAEGCLVGRSGGAEFVVFADDEARARVVVERVRAALRQLFCAERTRVVAQYPELAASTVLTVSVGAARARAGATIAALVQQSDAAMIEAKSAGRDGVRWAD